MINRIVYLVILIVFYIPLAFADPGAGEVSRGNAAYLKGDFSRAVDHYEAASIKAPNDPRIDYDLGTAAYKMGKYTEAIGLFNKALLGDDKKLQDDARYNLANSLYKAGIEKEKKDIKSAIKNVEESLGYYDKILATDSKKEDARENRVFVAAELERLKKEQQNRQQQKQDQQQDTSQKDRSQEQNEKDQGQQGKGQSEQNPAGENKKPEEKQSAEQKAEDQRQQKEQGASAGQSDQGHLLSQDEANMLLDDFAQNEQPRGLLNFVREPRQERPVSKDW